MGLGELFLMSEEKLKVWLAKDWSVKGLMSEGNNGNNRSIVPMVVEDGVAVITVSGVLEGGMVSDDECYWWGRVIMEAIKKSIEVAMSEGVETVVLKIDSPGGTVKGTMELAEWIYRLREEVKVYAYVEGVATSAAYWIASACEKVYATPTSEVGSIGVVSVIYDDEEFFKKIGIKKKEVVNEGSEKKNLDYFSEEGRKHLQKKLNEIAELFFITVARNRGSNVDEVKEKYGKGDSFLAEKASAVGMIDGVLGNYDDFKKTILGDTNMNEKEKETIVKATRKEERERVCAILSLTGDDEVKGKCIEKGMSFLEAKEAIVASNQEKLKEAPPLPTAKEDDYHQPSSDEGLRDKWADDVIQASQGV